MAYSTRESPKNLWSVSFPYWGHTLAELIKAFWQTVLWWSQTLQRITQVSQYHNTTTQSVAKHMHNMTFVYYIVLLVTYDFCLLRCTLTNIRSVTGWRMTIQCNWSGIYRNGLGVTAWQSGCSLFRKPLHWLVGPVVVPSLHSVYHSPGPSGLQPSV